MKYFGLWTVLSLLAISEGLQPELPVKVCQDESVSVSRYQALLLAYSTHYFTQLKIKEKNRAYT